MEWRDEPPEDIHEFLAKLAEDMKRSSAELSQAIREYNEVFEGKDKLELLTETIQSPTDRVGEIISESVSSYLTGVPGKPQKR
ncbi:hypothetical protein [Pseudomonas putida]|uniref:hypothetical protein n=1 Tax=Pseudomonas putida TaxID=303 RepID=UPI000CD400E3|nr:hypothetical protein [Pseudomonas putida]POF95322.1 hypothetical protein BGP81_00755 [Pseudomonas putida]